MILKASSIHFSYQDYPIIKDVDIELSDGELLGIIGPNGAGKSTLLRLLSGILKPQSGKISINGRPLEEYSPRRLARILTMLPQDNPVDFPYTCREFVMMGRYPYLGLMGWETPRDYQIVDECLESVGVIHLANRRIGELSGGERQRVALGRALAQKTRIILLDEPISHLDVGYQIEILELLKNINQKQKIAMMIVLHDLNLAARYCPGLLLLKDGTILAKGKPQHVLTTDLMKSAFNVQSELKVIPGWDFPFLLVQSSGRKTHGQAEPSS
ncbi:MAG: heme ABC transporter ATP-binding protein [Candidatus Eremiobacteraeota bacterium]|nr:heme ABC transporter ATP-binding protein [Candidatus Eremiobacteraeota bacterium]